MYEVKISLRFPLVPKCCNNFRFHVRHTIQLTYLAGHVIPELYIYAETFRVIRESLTVSQNFQGIVSITKLKSYVSEIGFRDLVEL